MIWVISPSTTWRSCRSALVNYLAYLHTHKHVYANMGYVCVSFLHIYPNTDYKF